METALLTELKSQFPQDNVLTDQTSLNTYGRDWTKHYDIHPGAIVFPTSADDVVKLVKWARKNKIGLVPSGGRTGLSGGACALSGEVVVSFEKMNKIKSFDATDRTVVCEPGVITEQLQNFAKDNGFYYPVDFAARGSSQIGGNIATNAGGSCCLKYGVTGDHVAALKVVLADGSVINTGSLTTKNVAGLDLTRLLVGSEGTLGVIIEATVRLLRAPRSPSTMIAFFDTLADAAKAIVEMDGRVDLSMLEVMDRTTIRAVEDLIHMDLDVDAAAFVLVQSDASDAATAIATCETICKQHEAKSVLCTDNVEEGRLLLAARRMALPALEKKGTVLLDDVAVPKPAIPAMLARIAEIAAARGLVIGTFGHAGDGNLHPTIVFDARDAASSANAYAAFDEIVRAAIALDGSITGEHGVGSLKRDYLGAMIGKTERALMARIKAAFDPRGILNPNKAI